MTTLEKAIRSRGRPLIGTVVQSYNTAYVEIIGRLGYDVLWIEMEHLPISFGQAADLCRVARGVGMLTMIRIPNANRDNVLKAAECGPDIIDVPMANEPQVARELVCHARYAPEGNRGFFLSSRAADYGLADDITELHAEINRKLCLLVQIETVEAVENAEQICQVRGLNGVFIGPGDLSTSLGHPGQTAHPRVEQHIARIISLARANNRIVAIAGAPNKEAKWSVKDVDLYFVGGEVSFVRQAARSCLERALRDLEA